MTGSQPQDVLDRERARVTEALAAAGLTGWEITPFFICETDDVGVQLERDESGETRESQREVWERIREAVLPLGRAPIGTELFYTDDLGGAGTHYGRRGWSDANPDDPAILPRALIDASFDIPPDETCAENFEREYPDYPEPSPGWFDQQRQTWKEHELRYELGVTEARIGEAPSVDEIIAALGQPRRGVLAGRGDSALDRYLFDWEEKRRPTTQPEREHEFSPPDDPWSCIHLLPTPWSWTSPAYLRFEGAYDRSTAQHLLAVLRSWNERHGTEVVSSDGILLELTSFRPAETLEDAYRMATQLHGAHREDGPTRQSARALWRRREFTLYQRP